MNKTVLVILALLLSLVACKSKQEKAYDDCVERAVEMRKSEPIDKGSADYQTLEETTKWAEAACRKAQDGEVAMPHTAAESELEKSSREHEEKAAQVADQASD